MVLKPHFHSKSEHTTLNVRRKNNEYKTYSLNSHLFYIKLYFPTWNKLGPHNYETTCSIPKTNHDPNRIIPRTNLYIFITRDLVKLFNGTHRKLFTSEIIPQNGKVPRTFPEYEISGVTGQATSYSSTICVTVFIIRLICAKQIDGYGNIFKTYRGPGMQRAIDGIGWVLISTNLTVPSFPYIQKGVI